MQENFVNYEIALELKELGFEEPCLATYRGGNNLYNGNVVGYYTDGWFEHFSSEDPRIWLAAPLWEQTTKWLRDKHNIHIYAVSYYEEDKWFYKVEKIGGTDILRPADADTYESALEAGIKAALTYLKQKNNES